MSVSSADTDQLSCPFSVEIVANPVEGGDGDSICSSVQLSVPKTLSYTKGEPEIIHILGDSEESTTSVERNEDLKQLPSSTLCPDQDPEDTPISDDSRELTIITSTKEDDLRQVPSTEISTQSSISMDDKNDESEQALVKVDGLKLVVEAITSYLPSSEKNEDMKKILTLVLVERTNFVNENDNSNRTFVYKKNNNDVLNQVPSTTSSSDKDNSLKQSTALVASSTSSSSDKDIALKPSVALVVESSSSLDKDTDLNPATSTALAIKTNSLLDKTSLFDRNDDSQHHHHELKQVPSTSVAIANDDTGMIESLTDQLSSIFSCQRQQVVSVPATDTSCRASCNVFDTRDPGTDVFSSLNYFWNPTKEIKPSKEPQNRSSQPRNKSRHINSLLDNWHPAPAETIVRSKSIVGVRRSQFITSHQPDGFYDSDPDQVYKKRERGESLKRQAVKDKYRNQRPHSLGIITTHGVSLYGDDLHYHHPPAPTNATRKSFRFPRDRSPTSFREYDIMHPGNDQYIREFVQEVTNTRLNLIWHRYSPQLEQDPVVVGGGLRAPLAVSMAFEVGTHLDNTVVQPKLTWSPTNKNSTDGTTTTTTTSTTNCLSKRRLSQADSDWIELLSVIRVFTPSRLNRSKYPFARSDRTLCIVANDERNPYLVFEAESPAQRDWFVTALKMTVARLASIIIVKDESMLMEFFSPYAALVNLQQQGGQQHGDEHHHHHHHEDEHDFDDEDEHDFGIDSTTSSTTSRDHHHDGEEDITGGIDHHKHQLDTNGELQLMNLPEVLIDPKKW